MLTTTAARDLIVGYLAADATAHDGANFDAIGRRFDSFEHNFPIDDGPLAAELRIALTFWDAWIDARNHGWQITAGIQPKEWPAIARTIADDLSNGRPIGDARVRARFDAASNGGLSERVQWLAGRLRDRRPHG
jgi:hypothetical protein